MLSLSTLGHKKKKIQRIGRGSGSHRGNFSGRGGKGPRHRQGHRRRHHYEGGQVPLYRKVPERGFTRGLFLKRHTTLSLAKIDQYFSEGEVVSIDSLLRKGWLTSDKRFPGGIKILAVGELTKKVTFKENEFYASKAAVELIEKFGLKIETKK